MPSATYKFTNGGANQIDTYIDSVNADTINGGAQSMNLGDVASGVIVFRVLCGVPDLPLAFPGLTTESTILTAQMTFNVSTAPASNMGFRVYRGLTPYNENTTWNSFNGGGVADVNYDSTVFDADTFNAGGLPQSFNVINTVQAALISDFGIWRPIWIADNELNGVNGAWWCRERGATTPAQTPELFLEWEDSKKEVGGSSGRWRNRYRYSPEVWKLGG